MLPSNIGNLINLRHLDITRTGLYSKAGRFDGTELQNVSDVQDANEAKLRTKQNIEELTFAWCGRNFNDFQNENLEMNVLNMLQPHGDLKRLKIKFYGGTKFPSWIGDPSFSKMVNLSLVNCPKCKILPPFGQLPNLKELCIQGMTELQNLGVEFCGDCFPPFPSLKSLRFESMPAWDEWDCCIDVEEAGRQFPCQRELKINGCPKLNRISLLMLPSLRTLFLRGCDEAVLQSIVDVTSLTSLNVTSITGLLHLDEALVQYLVALESLTLFECNQLVAFWQNNLLRPQLVSFGEELDEGLPCINLQELYIIDCVNFEKFPNELHNLTSLASLEIVGCPKLVEFPKTGVPPMLKLLQIQECNALKSLPDGICGLERLSIFYCSSLEYFQQQQQDMNMSSLQQLDISGWPKVGMLVLGIGRCVNNFASLRRLWIQSFDVVECLSFPERGLPNLSQLVIHNCVNLRSFAATTITNLILPSLQSLQIKYCEKLESIPEGGVCLSTPKLRSLCISSCSNLTSLPFFDQILQSLETIEIYNCPFLESYLQGIGNLPPNLIEFVPDFLADSNLGDIPDPSLPRFKVFRPRTERKQNIIEVSITGCLHATPITASLSGSFRQAKGSNDLPINQE
ncbi:putative disease resistance RPP13-like protein 1 [Cornus florida]|uniref:putative disease resistance RPP13-like protein 1 n=1 Tax=Cornus florida TaxID=4283 RepID=UPI002896B26C|nr:putative disease resistance RPP13-like protein 1 [Cornus florida]